VKTIILAMLLIVSISSSAIASPDTLVITLNKSSLDSDGKYVEDSLYVDSLIKESIKNKINILSPESYTKRFSDYHITDLSVAERNDIVLALRDSSVKYVIVSSLHEVFSQYVEIHCRVIDVKNNKYLLNRSDREMGGAWASRNTIRKAIVPIKTEMDNLIFED